MKKTFDVKRLTTLALLTTIALTIFVVESAIPTLVPIPGVKLGLANIVTLFVLKRYKFSDAAIVLAMRIILATIFTGQAVSFIYSVSGGFLCLIVMAAVNKLLRGQYIFLTGILGAVSHNAGQILAAFFRVKTVRRVCIYAISCDKWRYNRLVYRACVLLCRQIYS